MVRESAGSVTLEKAGFSMKWSTEQVKGQISPLKTVK